MQHSLKIFLATSSIIVLGLVSCSSTSNQSTLQLGPQTLTGALSPIELSLTRRGTHILRSNGSDVAYLESSTVNLRDFEGMDVSVHGLLQKNTGESDLPVLVADKISLVQEPSRVWEVPALHIKLSAPIAWNAAIFTDGIRFTQAGSTDALVQIIHSSLPALPSGTPIVIGGKQAVRTDTGSGQVVYVQNAKDVIAITISSSLSGARGKSPAQSVMRLLTSIVFTNADAGSGAYVNFGSGSHQGGAPCGGTAGILCPSGSFCNITDRSSGIGMCMMLP